MSKEKAQIYREMLSKLESEYQADVESREMATGNQQAIYAEVGRRIVADKEYQTKRSRYLEAINEEEEVSSGVTSFLKKDEPVSKFDFDNGKAKDDSMNPLSGKRI
jgi:hypothetical protein